MTTGIASRGEKKYLAYLKTIKYAWDNRSRITDHIINCDNTMQTTCKDLTDLYMVGKFIAYEITCDLRFTNLLRRATDKLTWANMGPGAKRGLLRLGYPCHNQKEGCISMIDLYRRILTGDLRQYLIDDILDCKWPFELREIEHNLCEFDKYQRVKTGVGRPKSRYNGSI